MLITDKNELKKYTAANRLWQGIPSIEITEGGTLYYSFFSGSTGEYVGNFSALLRSDDDGKTWSEPVLVAFEEGQMRCFDPCVWRSPTGRLWFYWAQREMVTPERKVFTYASYTDNPDDKDPVWSEPIMLGPGVMINKPLIKGDGEILFCISSWALNTERIISVYSSSDNGDTMKKIGEAKCPSMIFGEQVIVERADLSLAMYFRTRFGIGIVYSYDGGRSWSAEQNSDLKGPGGRFFLGRLKNGKLLLVNHHDFNDRNNIKAMLSEDDGKTWYGYLMIDERQDVSYANVAEGADGKIYIAYDRKRGSSCKSLEQVLKIERELLMAVVTEQDIASGKLVNEESRLKVIVNKLGEYAGENKNPYQEADKYSDAEYVNILLQLNNGEKVVDRIFCDYDYHCVNMPLEKVAALDDMIDKIKEADSFENNLDAEYLIKNIAGIVRNISPGKNVTMPNAMVDKIFEYINAHLSVDFSLDDMAKALCMSKYYLCFIFKRKTDTTIVQYRNYRRISLAKKYLAKSDLTVTDISGKVGFGDSAYFTKWFRQIEGVTPSEYRKQIGTAK